MKTTLSLLLLVAASAQAGLPEQDPAVNYLQGQFNSGSIPTDNDLLNRTWSCSEVLAYRDTNRRTDIGEFFMFTKYDGLFLNTPPNGHNPYPTFALTDNGLAGVMEIPRDDKLLIRVSAHGDLIGERTWKEVFLKNGDMCASKFDSKRAVFSYIVCPK